MYAVSYHVNPCASMCRILVLLIWCVRGSVYVMCVTKWMYAGGLQEGRKDIKTRRHQLPPFMLSKRWRSSTAFLNLHLTQEPLFPFHSLLCFFPLSCYYSPAFSCLLSSVSDADSWCSLLRQSSAMNVVRSKRVSFFFSRGYFHSVHGTPVL